MGEPDLLASAYRSALELASQHELTSIAFPSISTGIYGYPMELASEIAVREARAFGESHPEIEIIFCSYNAEAFELYKRLING
jgi:O-acetyl-ADP-ribose deacetylase (regulator of RNase III)